MFSLSLPDFNHQIVSLINADRMYLIDIILRMFRICEMDIFEDDISLVLWSKNYEDIVDKTDEAVSILRDTFSELGLGFIDAMTYIMIFGKLSYSINVTIIVLDLKILNRRY